ncbi:MAG: hypothetical protein E6H72_07300 [Betaproteobacteria bacterium]|nr:MAG: hypothetical protein E6H72_07300 [Betaproteobacteria bacterium]
MVLARPCWWRACRQSTGSAQRPSSVAYHIRLTLPSSGRPTARFAACRSPLMSNVRWHVGMQRRWLLATQADTESVG